MRDQTKFEKVSTFLGLAFFISAAFFSSFLGHFWATVFIYLSGFVLVPASISWLIRYRGNINLIFIFNCIKIPSAFISLPIATAIAHNEISQALGFPSIDFPASLGLMTALYYIPTLFVFVGAIISLSAMTYLSLAAFFNMMPFRSIVNFFANKMNAPPAGNMGGVSVIGFLIMAIGIGFFSIIEKYNSPVVRRVAFIFDYANLWNYPGYGVDKILIHGSGIVSAAFIDENGKVNFKVVDSK